MARIPLIIPALFFVGPFWFVTVVPLIQDGFGAALQEGSLSYLDSPAPIWATVSIVAMLGPLVLLVLRQRLQTKSAPPVV